MACDTAMDWRRWCSRPDDADRSVLMRVEGTTLDVGCGPGRLTVALTARGHAVLGIDVTPDAVSLTRAAGGVALHRSVFTHIPGEGRWDTVLLIDGNVGIGGDPVALLRRVWQLLAPTGCVLIELEPPTTIAHVGPARIRHADGVVTSWFPWARVPVDANWRHRGRGRLRDARVLVRRRTVVHRARTGEAAMILRVLTKPLPTAAAVSSSGSAASGILSESVAIDRLDRARSAPCSAAACWSRSSPVSRATWPNTHSGDSRFRRGR